jgi:hypothetical protein
VKIAMQLTLDGMIRALRLKAHTVGEDMKRPCGGPSSGARRR